MRTASIALIVVMGLHSAQPRAQVPADAQLKAAFVIRFLQFIEWPAAVWDRFKTFDLCVLRPAELLPQLETLARGESVHGKPIVVRALAGDDIASCAAVFIGAKSPAALAALRAAAPLPILTVGDGDAFLDEGGIIVLRRIDRRVRFDIDLGRARAAGLRISSRLLTLANDVRGGPS